MPEPSQQRQMSPDEALARLVEGNRRFVADDLPAGDTSRSRRLEVARGQRPFAALVGCSDSRVGPEQLFGTGLGDLFIVRTAGSSIGANSLGSIEFAVAKLEVPLVVVLGHERCGAIEAAIEVVESGLELPGAMAAMIEPILPAVRSAKARLQPGEDLVTVAAHENVHIIAERLRASGEVVLDEPLAAGRLKIVGAYYDLETGAVDMFDVEARDAW